MENDDLKVIGFAAIVCVVCSLLISGASASLKGRQDRNIELDRKFNVLKAFGHTVENEKGKRTISDDDIDDDFAAYISEVIVDRDGKVLDGVTSADLTKDDKKEKTRLPLYLWTEDGEVTRYAFPISGYGLWSTIYGYMALERDLATIIGVTFFKHNETPGLGGECSEPWFMEQFAEKRVHDGSAPHTFEVVKGGVAAKYPEGNDHAVDGISAATITSNGIQSFINGDLALYEPYFANLRGS